MSQQYELINGDRRVRFTGELLAHITTHAPDMHRWQELNLYKTEAGKYVLQKVGVTTVYHREEHSYPGNIRVNGPKLMRDNPGVGRLLNGCTVCRPESPQHQGWIALEVNRYTVHVSETAGGIVESARTRDEDGALFMSRTAERLLLEAGRVDAALREAFAVEDVA